VRFVAETVTDLERVTVMVVDLLRERVIVYVLEGVIERVKGRVVGIAETERVIVGDIE
jgi:hypothetical protein